MNTVVEAEDAMEMTGTGATVTRTEGTRQDMLETPDAMAAAANTPNVTVNKNAQRTGRDMIADGMETPEIEILALDGQPHRAVVPLVPSPKTGLVHGHFRQQARRNRTINRQDFLRPKQTLSGLLTATAPS